MFQDDVPLQDWIAKMILLLLALPLFIQGGMLLVLELHLWSPSNLEEKATLFAIDVVGQQAVMLLLATYLLCVSVQKDQNLIFRFLSFFVGSVILLKYILTMNHKYSLILLDVGNYFLQGTKYLKQEVCTVHAVKRVVDSEALTPHENRSDIFSRTYLVCGNKTYLLDYLPGFFIAPKKGEHVRITYFPLSKTLVDLQEINT